MFDQPQLGATGEFPDGKSRDDDEGEIRIAVGPDRKGNVVIDFGKPVAWIAFDPGKARWLALTLLKHAAAVDGAGFSVDVVSREG